MHRATPFDSSFRGYSSGGARSVVHEVDDSKEMQEGKGNFMKGESGEGIEAPQNYGFTSVVMDADKDKDGKVTGSAETFVSFMGGNRSFPVYGNMDDRRHRLKGLEKGDVAMFRTKNDKQQFHMTGDGGFWSAPEDKTVRMQLVKKDQQQQGGQGGGGTGGGGASTRAADGGGGGSNQPGQQGQGKEGSGGQKAVRKDSTHRFVDVTQDNTNMGGTNTRHLLDDGKCYLHCSADKNVWVGAEKGKAAFAKILTLNGPSVDSFAALSKPSLRSDEATPRYPTDVEPPPTETPPPVDEFPFPVDPDRAYYAETSWFDAHTSADAWADFNGNPQSPGPYYVPFKFLTSETAGQAPSSGALGTGMLGLNGRDGRLYWRDYSNVIVHANLVATDFAGNNAGYGPFTLMRSDAAGAVPAALTPGGLGLNGADGHLFWRDSAGAVQSAALAAIASIPGLLAVHSIAKLDLIGASNASYALDPRTTMCVAFLYGGSGGANTIATTPGGAGGNTSIAGVATANGGQGTGWDTSGTDPVPLVGAHGSGSGGLVIPGSGPAGARVSSSYANGLSGGNGGMVIAVFAASGSLNITVGSPGGGNFPGNGGGVFLVELT